jgi:hypothetical protein
MTYSSDIAKLARHKCTVAKMTLDGGTIYLVNGDIPPTLGAYYNCVENVSVIPSRAAEAGGIGYFGDITIKARDFQYNQDDPSAGTYFGRVIADNTYYLNRIVDIYAGYYKHEETFNLSNFQKRTYFLKQIDGPDNNGLVIFKASDVMSRLKESECPAATNGSLNASITNSQTGTINITDNTGFTAGGGYAIVNDEILQYSSTSGGDSIVVSTRGVGGTTADAHDSGDAIRHIERFNANVVNVIRDIIEDFTDIDHATYLPDTDWNTQRDTFLSSETVDYWVIEPTPCDKLIDKLCKDCYVNVWWDDANQEIKLQALGPSIAPSITWTDEANILDAQIKIKRDQRKILTAVWYFYGKIDQAGSDSANNYESIYINIDSSLQTSLGEEKVKKIFSNTVPSSGTGTATKVSGRLIDQFKIPVEFSCYVDAKDSTADVGDGITISTSLIQDSNGSPLPTIMRIIEKAESDNDRYFYKMIKTGQETGDRYAVIGPNTLNDYTSESQANQDAYGFISNNTPEMSNADDPYLIL